MSLYTYIYVYIYIYILLCRAGLVGLRVFECVAARLGGEPSSP